MGLQIVMRASWKDTQAELCEDFPREAYGQLGVITGMTVEKVSQEGWSQLVDRETARRIAQAAGLMEKWAKLVNPFHVDSCMIRVTIA